MDSEADPNAWHIAPWSSARVTFLSVCCFSGVGALGLLALNAGPVKRALGGSGAGNPYTFLALLPWLAVGVAQFMARRAAQPRQGRLEAKGLAVPGLPRRKWVAHPTRPDTLMQSEAVDADAPPGLDWRPDDAAVTFTALRGGLMPHVLSRILFTMLSLVMAATYERFTLVFFIIPMLATLPLGLKAAFTVIVRKGSVAIGTRLYEVVPGQTDARAGEGELLMRFLERDGSERTFALQTAGPAEYEDALARTISPLPSDEMKTGPGDPSTAQATAGGPAR